jgi:hypothetical protein
LAAAVFAAPGVAAPRGAQPAAAARAELPSKPTGPIAVEHHFRALPSVGTPLAIAITARVEGQVAELGIEASATTPSAVLVTQPRLLGANGGVYSWEITVVPLRADAGYLSVIVSGAIDGVDQARSVTIPLRGEALGADTVPSRGDETLIALPVEESP